MKKNKKLLVFSLVFWNFLQVATISVGTFFIAKKNNTNQNRINVLEEKLNDVSVSSNKQKKASEDKIKDLEKKLIDINNVSVRIIIEKEKTKDLEKKLKNVSNSLNNLIEKEQQIVEIKNKINEFPKTSSKYLNSQIDIMKKETNNLNFSNLKNFDKNNLEELILKANKVERDLNEVTNHPIANLYNKEEYEDYKNYFLKRYDDELENNNYIDTKDFMKNWLLYKLKQLKEFWTNLDVMYLQPQKRLEFLVENYENNYNKDILFQWGIGEDNMWGLNPTKFKGFQSEIYKMNDENIFRWIKHYNEMKWLKVDKENQIEKISKENVDVFKTPQTIKNKIIKEYVNNTLDFKFVDWSEIWNTKTDEEYFKIAFERKGGFSYSRVTLINELNTENNIHAAFSFNKYKTSEANKKIYIYLQAKNFDYDKYYSYAKEPSEIVFSPEIYGLHHFKKANFFEDFVLNRYDSYVVKVKNSETIENSIFDFDKGFRKTTYNVTRIDKSDPVLTSKKNIREQDRISKNPIPYFRKWMQEWMDVLPKIINKSWSNEQKIKAVSYYILTNATYLKSSEDIIINNYNSDGHNFISPLAFFDNDRQIQCNGYASNLSMALTLLNIPIRIVGGFYFRNGLENASDEEHAWNEVFLDNRWKAIDLTNWDRWDSTSSVINLQDLKDSLIFSEWIVSDENPLIMERNSEHMKKYRLDISSYVSTILKYQNPKEYEYEELPTSYELKST